MSEEKINQLENMNTVFEKLQQENAALKKQNADKSGECASLRDSHEGYKRKAKDDAETIAELRKKLTDCQEFNGYKPIVDENDALQKRNDLLNIGNQKAAGTIAALKAENERLKKDDQRRV